MGCTHWPQTIIKAEFYLAASVATIYFTHKMAKHLKYDLKKIKRRHVRYCWSHITLTIGRIHHLWRIRTRLHQCVLRGHAGILWRHRITRVWILGMSQWFSISVIHGLHWVTGHGDLLGWGTKKMLSCEDRIILLWLGLTIKRCPPPLLSPLVEVTAGAHEAAHHGRDDGHKQEDGGGDASYGGWAEGAERRCTFYSLKALLHKLVLSNVSVGYATPTRKLSSRDVDMDDVNTSKCVKSLNCVAAD